MLTDLIEQFYEQRHTLTPSTTPPALREAIHEVLQQLNVGQLRVAAPIDGQWVVFDWVKKAILLAFKCYDNQVIDAGFCQFYDKLPLKYEHTSQAQFQKESVRIVPHAMVRQGAFIGKGAILMPSYVNVGAYIGEETLIDTWATVGSCAQIGHRVHLSGGAGIGGVLEPLQAHPTIIEDNCFIGARSEIVEGVIVERDAVISMGVFIGQSTKIYDRETKTITYGRIPQGAVVVPGQLPSEDGSHSLACAVIIKRVDEKTRAKTSINDLLR